MTTKTSYINPHLTGTRRRPVSSTNTDGSDPPQGPPVSEQSEQIQQNNSEFIKDNIEGSKPSHTNISPTTPGTSSLSCNWCIALFVVALGSFFMFFSSSSSSQQNYTNCILHEAGWKTKINVLEMVLTAVQGWEDPKGLTGLVSSSIQQELREKSYESVLDHYEEKCIIEIYDDVFEVYSHSEEVCEENDVYDSTGLYVRTDRTCHTKDIYTPGIEKKERNICNNVPIYRKVPIMATFYSYKLETWVPRTLSLAQSDGSYPAWPVVNQQIQKEQDRTELFNLVFKCVDEQEGKGRFVYLATNSIGRNEYLLERKHLSNAYKRYNVTSHGNIVSHYNLL